MFMLGKEKQRTSAIEASNALFYFKYNVRQNLIRTLKYWSNEMRNLLKKKTT